MRTSLLYNVSVECDEFPEEDDYFTHEYFVDVSCQDIVEYLYFERYEKYWNPLSWYLEEGAREFVKDIEDSWLRDDIDEYGMLRDLSLKDFLKSKYIEDVRRECRINHYNYLVDCYPDYAKSIEVYCEVE